MSMGRQMLELVRSEVCGGEMQEPPTVDATRLSSLYAMAEAHDMAHIVAGALERLGVQDAEWMPRFEKHRMVAIFRYQQMDYEYNRFCDTMERAGIGFIPLKGSVLRHDYPEAWMRTGCDLDFLIREEDLGRATAALTEQLGYVQGERSGHDISFFSPNRVHIELHFALVGEWRANGCARILDRVWEDYSLPVRDKAHERAMTDEMFYLYHIAHMAKHIEAGGCGVRPFLDLWILNHLKRPFEPERRDALLREAQLHTFAKAAEKLSRVWFSGEACDGLSEGLEEYILRSGAYGTVDNKIALRSAKQGGGRRGYILSRIFQPYSYMKKRYPVLQKHKWLLPFYQVRRWLGVLSPAKLKGSVKELNMTRTISEEKRRKSEELLRQLEL